MSEGELIKTYMAAAGMLMEDASAKMLLEPLGDARVDELRQLANDLTRIADLVAAARQR